jgi:4-amino-4-deoxy-L-arabinose transferase-like glycosyltransferase
MFIDKMHRLIQRISLVHLLILSFILNFSMYYAVRSWNPDVEKNILLTRDSHGYELLAENMLQYHSFAGTFDTLDIPQNSDRLEASYLIVNYDTYREPVYPGFLALIYWVTGIKPFIAVFIQILLNVFSLALIYRIVLLLFDNKEVATIAGLIFAVDIHSIFVANTLLSDTLFVFLLLLSIYYFLSGLQHKSLAKCSFSAVFIGLACLTRPVLLLYPFVLLFMIIVFYKNPLKWTSKMMVLYFAITYFLVGLWAFRNHITYGKWQLNTMNGYNLLMANVAISESRDLNIFIENVRAKLDAQCDSLGCLKLRNPFDRSSLCEKVSWKYIKNNKKAFFDTQVWGAVHMFLSLGNIDMAEQLGWPSSDVEGQLLMDSKRLQQNFAHKKQALLGILIILALILQYVGALFGIFFLVKNRKYQILAFCIITILYFSVFTGAIGKYRYKLPMQLAIISMSGYGYSSILRRKSETGVA